MFNYFFNFELDFIFVTSYTPELAFNMYYLNIKEYAHTMQ